MSWSDFCEMVGWDKEDAKFLTRIFEGGEKE